MDILSVTRLEYFEPLEKQVRHLWEDSILPWDRTRKIAACDKLIDIGAPNYAKLKRTSNYQSKVFIEHLKRNLVPDSAEWKHVAQGPKVLFLDLGYPEKSFRYEPIVASAFKEFVVEHLSVSQRVEVLGLFKTIFISADTRFQTALLPTLLEYVKLVTKYDNPTTNQEALIIIKQMAIEVSKQIPALQKTANKLDVSTQTELLLPEVIKKSIISTKTENVDTISKLTQTDPRENKLDVSTQTELLLPEVIKKSIISTQTENVVTISKLTQTDPIQPEVIKKPITISTLTQTDPIQPEVIHVKEVIIKPITEYIRVDKNFLVPSVAKILVHFWVRKLSARFMMLILLIIRHYEKRVIQLKASAEQKQQKKKDDDCDNVNLCLAKVDQLVEQIKEQNAESQSLRSKCIEIESEIRNETRKTDKFLKKMILKHELDMAKIRRGMQEMQTQQKLLQEQISESQKTIDHLSAEDKKKDKDLLEKFEKHEKKTEDYFIKHILTKKHLDEQLEKIRDHVTGVQAYVHQMKVEQQATTIPAFVLNQIMDSLKPQIDQQVEYLIQRKLSELTSLDRKLNRVVVNTLTDVFSKPREERPQYIDELRKPFAYNSSSNLVSDEWLQRVRNEAFVGRFKDETLSNKISVLFAKQYEDEMTEIEWDWQKNYNKVNFFDEKTFCNWFQNLSVRQKSELSLDDILCASRIFGVGSRLKREGKLTFEGNQGLSKVMGVEKVSQGSGLGNVEQVGKVEEVGNVKWVGKVKGVGQSYIMRDRLAEQIREAITKAGKRANR
jgi:hypothetical protein